MEENRNERLDQFFRDHMNKGSRVSAPWNEPDDGIFDLAFERTREIKNRKRNRKILFMLFGFGALFLTSSLLYMINKVDHLNSKMADMESKFQAYEYQRHEDELLKNAREEALESTVFGERVVNPATEDIKSTVSDAKENQQSLTSIISNTPIRKSSLPTSQASSPNPSTAMSNTMNSAREYQDLNNGAVFTASSHDLDASAFMNKTLLSMTLMPQLPYAPNTNNKTEIRTLNTTLRVADDKKVDVKRPWEISLMAMGNISSMRMTDITMPDNSSLTQYNNGYASFGINSKVSHGISDRVSPYLSIGYHQFKNESLYNATSKMTMDNLQEDPDGNIYYGIDYSSENPVGRSRSHADMDMKGIDYTDDSLIENLSNNTQHFSIAQLGIGVDYKAFSSGKLEAVVGLGMMNNFLFSTKCDVTSTLSMDGKKMMESQSPDTYEDLSKRYFLSITPSIGLKYGIGDRVGVSLLYQYDKGLTNIREADLSVSPKTFIFSHRLGLGINYKL